MPPPKARICFICGRPTLLPGYDRHVEQCRDLFIKREMQKPPKERRPCPKDPMEFSGKGGRYSEKDMNEMAMKSFESSLAPCPNCGRTFLPEKLAIHARSCTSANPAKRIGFTNSQQLPNNSPMTQDIKGKTSSSYYDEEDYGSSFNRSSIRSSSMKLSGGQDQLPDFPDYGHLIKCKDCGRNFNPESFEKHTRICRKVFKQKRKPFDSAKHRAEGTELASYQKLKSRTTKSSAFSDSRSLSNKTSSNASKWKQESMSFRQFVRNAKLISKAEQQSKSTGIPLHRLLPSNPSMSMTAPQGPEQYYIQCPHCGRKFNEKAAERHIPKCQSIINKPKSLTRTVPSSLPSSSYSQQSMGNSATISKYNDFSRDFERMSIGSNKVTNNRSYSNDPVAIRGGAPARRTSLGPSSGRMSYADDPPTLPTSNNRSGVNDPVRLQPAGSGRFSSHSSVDFNQPARKPAPASFSSHATSNSQSLARYRK